MQNDRIKRTLELFAIWKEKSVGRYALKDMLDLPEGKTRGRLKKLLDEGLIRETKQGAVITKRGERALRSLLSSMNIAAMDIINVGPLKTGNESTVVHVRGRASEIETAKYTHLRDEAVKVGAQGATIIIFGNGKLSVPAVFPDLETEYQSIARMLLKEFDLASGDILIVGSALTKWKALEGALAIALALSEK
ncbi:MAG: DUF4443 domain-containing protein [Candidatus Hodarchaeota archaeon]